MSALLFYLLIAGFAVFFGLRWLLRRRRRGKLLAAPLSAERRAIAVRAVPLYNKLPDDLRVRLEGLVNRFLDEVDFYGQQGLDVTEEMRVTIAVQACFLIVNKENRWFHSLRTVHLYPAAFKNRLTEIRGAVHAEKQTVRSGESWARGPVILAWDHACYGAFVPHDGRNVVFHEFAHQLDEQTGVVDGAPTLDEDQSATKWARVFQAAYARLRSDLGAGRASLIDPYGATSPAEFFAVVTEIFFERPWDLRQAEPDLYAELSQYYRLDPATWR